MFINSTEDSSECAEFCYLGPIGTCDATAFVGLGLTPGRCSDGGN